MKIKTTLTNIRVKESDHEEERKVVHDGSKKRKECSPSQKMDKVCRLSLGKSEEKNENEEKPLTFTIANREIQLPFSYKERLARDSDFFRGLFANPMQGRVTGKYKLEDIELEEFQKLITLWSGDSTVSAQEAVDLLEVGYLLGLGEPLVDILIPTIKSWSPTDVGDIEAACALSSALYLDSLPSLKSELETFLVKAYLAASNHEAQTLLERIIILVKVYLVPNNHLARNLLKKIQILDMRDLNLNESSVNDRNLENLINVCPNLATLALQRTCITDRSAEQIAKLSKLTTLDVSECRFLTDAAMEPLAKLSNVASLNVSYCRLTDAGLEQMAKFPKLTNLNLMGCEHLSDTGLRSVSKLSKLGSLNLNGWKKGGLEWIATQLPNLTSLQLSNCLLTDTDMQWIARLTHLTSLDISGWNEVTDAGFKEIAKLFNLRHLGLSCSRNLTRGSMRLVAEKCHQLTSLNLTGYDRKGEDLIEIAPFFSNLIAFNLNESSLAENEIIQIVKRLPKLMHLGISGCWGVTDSAIKHLAPLLPDLKSLNICYCLNLTDEGVRELTVYRSLRELNMSWCENLTDVSVDYLVQLPKLIGTSCPKTITETAIKKMRSQGIRVV